MSLNLVITMTLCGLWHGANWTFVAFGVAQGLMQLVHHRFRNFVKPRKKFKKFLQSGPGETLRILVTYITVVVLPSVLFRSQDFRTAAQIFYRLFVPHDGMSVNYPLSSGSLAFAFGILAICHVVADRGLWKKIAARFTPAEWGFAYALLLVLALMMAPESQKAFIYFQF